ncbi:TOMM precursor leader peptide-binding protein [Nocardia mangyaensis]|uniref:TOMM precursor leader peptide-binding protein n=1 Tax=Nocardia mangyaensis TaxID=2213200 RepID=UPI00267743CE|nr:TOMM precursor leader peptide-binding protein [Nocardia mangyaensis]MDO3645602.1 TOMM precursor leader peptide-binding protein [Nocardia mangyaensis]
MTTTTPLRGPMLHPRVITLVRPSGTVQLGWDPERALLLETHELDTSTVLAFLRLLDGLQSRPQIIWRAGEFGITPERTDTLLAAIEGAGLLLEPERGHGRIRAITVHGLGPLSDAVSMGLRRMGLRPARSRPHRRDALVAATKCDLIVLADALMIDPRLSVDLVLRRIPHLPVRVRDGVGVVGPLVLPGETSCLRCADLTRAGFDADWPHLAAQLLGRTGHASPAGVAATAALAMGELEAIVACSPRRRPGTLDATVELDLDTHQVQRRRWPPHPECGCRTLTPRASRTSEAAG